MERTLQVPVYSCIELIHTKNKNSPTLGIQNTGLDHVTYDVWKWSQIYKRLFLYNVYMYTSTPTTPASLQQSALCDKRTMQL